MTHKENTVKISKLQWSLKVEISCMAISEPWVWINGQLQSLHNFLQNCVKLCFKEVLSWLSTVLLCELLLIVPTINRFVINNWNQSVHHTIQHFGLYTKAIIRDNTRQECLCLNTIPRASIRWRHQARCRVFWPIRLIAEPNGRVWLSISTLSVSSLLHLCWSCVVHLLVGCVQTFSVIVCTQPHFR